MHNRVGNPYSGFRRKLLDAVRPEIWCQDCLELCVIYFSLRKIIYDFKEFIVILVVVEWA